MKLTALLPLTLAFACSSVCKKQEVDLIVPARSMPIVFPDGVPVGETKFDGKFFFRHGMGDGHDCHISRTPAREVDGLLVVRMNEATESCIGKDCSECDFKPKGGCECRGFGECSHAVVRNSVLLKGY